jgi:hypothetical protein
MITVGAISRLLHDLAQHNIRSRHGRQMILHGMTLDEHRESVEDTRFVSMAAAVTFVTYSWGSL